MSNAVWFVHGENDGTVEVRGRKYSAGGSGAPMLCSLVCKSLGRHIHIDACRSADDNGFCGGGPGIQHINDPDGNKYEDLISHRVFWRRSGRKMFHLLCSRSLIPVFRVFRYEWRPFAFRLTDSLSCLLQIPIPNKSKLILIFGQYHLFKVIISCAYCLPSDYKCGGETLSLTSSLCGSPLLQVRNMTVPLTLVQCRPTAFCHCSMPQHEKVKFLSARPTVWHLWSHMAVINPAIGHVSGNGHAFSCKNPAQMQRASNL
jgi:hypothetical protein